MNVFASVGAAEQEWWTLLLHKCSDCDFFFAVTALLQSLNDNLPRLKYKWKKQVTGVCLKIGAEVCECVCVEALQTIARVKQVPQPLIWCMIHIQHIYEMRN